MGEWIAGSAFRGTINIYDGERQVAVVGTAIAPDEEQVKRDAAVIVAAHDLLAACRAGLHALRMAADHRSEIEELEAAISKAESDQ